MRPKNKYSVEIIWSEEDELYLARAKELPGCLADGATADEACRNLSVIVEEWLETAKLEGRKIPEPVTLESLEQYRERIQKELQQQVQKHIQKAVQLVLQNASRHQGSSSIPHWRESGLAGFDLSRKEKT